MLSPFKSDALFTFIAEMKTTNLILQQGMALVLGHVGSQTYPQGINEALECLLGVVNRSV